MGLNYIFYITIIFIIITFILFEKTTNKIETLTLVSTLSALACVGRIMFSSIPSVQPSSFIIIASGLILTPIPSLTIGVMTAFSSSLVLGFGTYTFYQAFLWGLMGLISSLLKKIFIISNDNNYKVRLPLLVVYSFIFGVLFGSVMNLSYFSFMNIPFDFRSYLSLCIISLPMDIAHGLSNAILFMLVGNRFVNILARINKKYYL